MFGCTIQTLIDCELPRTAAETLGLDSRDHGSHLDSEQLTVLATDELIFKTRPQTSSKPNLSSGNENI